MIGGTGAVDRAFQKDWKSSDSEVSSVGGVAESRSVRVAVIR